MKTYTLSAQVTVSAFTYVRAKSEADAIGIAKGRTVALDGNGESPEESWIIEEADGEVANISCE